MNIIDYLWWMSTPEFQWGLVIGIVIGIAITMVVIFLAFWPKAVYLTHDGREHKVR